MSTNKDFRVSFKMPNAQLTNVSFSEAANALEGHIGAEFKACYRVQYGNEWDTGWVKWTKSIPHFWSEVLGNTRPPADEEWMKPIATLRSSRAAYNRGDFSLAESQLINAFNQYKELHKKWMEYRKKVLIGADRAISGIEFTITILSTVVTSGIGVASTGLKGAVIKGAYEAALKGGTTTVTEVAKKITMNDKIDIKKIILKSGTAFGGSLLGGALSNIFKSYVGKIFNEKLVKSLETNFKGWKWVETSFGRSLVLSKPSKTIYKQIFVKKIVADFLGRIHIANINSAINKAYEINKKKSVTMKEFIWSVADQYVEQFSLQFTQNALQSFVRIYMEYRK